MKTKILQVDRDLIKFEMKLQGINYRTLGKMFKPNLTRQGAFALIKRTNNLRHLNLIAKKLLLDTREILKEVSDGVDEDMVERVEDEDEIEDNDEIEDEDIEDEIEDDMEMDEDDEEVDTMKRCFDETS